MEIGPSFTSELGMRFNRMLENRDLSKSISEDDNRWLTRDALDKEIL